MDTNLWVKLASKVLGHSQASRIGLKLLLIKHTVHLTGLAARRGGISPADSGSGKTKTKPNIRVKSMLLYIFCVSTCTFRKVPVRARCGRSAPGANRRGSRFHIHSTAKEFQVHVHLQQGKMLNPKSKSKNEHTKNK